MLRSAMYALAAMLVAQGVAARAEVTLLDCASPVNDFHIKSSILSRDMDALKIISPEFAQSYRVGASEIWFKEPHKLKVASKSGLINVTYIINGNQKVLRAGWIHKTWDITHTPGQRQTPLTVGLVTPSWVDLVDVTPKGMAQLNGRKVAIFEAHYKDEPRGTYFRLYMDPERKYAIRQDQIHGDGAMKVTMRFLAPVKQKGIWIPTKTEVINAKGQRGAVTSMQTLSVNTGLPDSLFAL